MIVIGKLGRTHGVQGWLKLHSFTEPLSNVLEYQAYFIRHKADQPWQPFNFVTKQLSPAAFLLKPAGCNTLEQAQPYVNAELAVARDQLPALTEQELYWADLEGLRVTNLQGIELGIITQLMATGANDVLVVKGERERLLPYISSVIQKVDPAEKTLLVDWDADF
ncbi:MAG: ribosome maturation factor RimM [Gammaproteobacteria bacterium]